MKRNILSDGCLPGTSNTQFCISHETMKFVISPRIQMTHVNEGGKYGGPKHHRKHLCQQGAEVLLIKMYREGTGCTPNESRNYFNPN